MLKLIILASVAVLSATAAQAADKCYEERFIPETYNCGAGGKGNFADFSNGGCTIIPSSIEKTEVECPGRWVSIGSYNVSEPAPTASAVCARKGLKPSNLEGKTCASGERRPTTGGDWDLINYVWGTKGGRTAGGDEVQHASRWGHWMGGDNESEPNQRVHTGSFCYDKRMGAKNNTKQDRVVAYFCDK